MAIEQSWRLLGDDPPADTTQQRNSATGLVWLTQKPGHRLARLISLPLPSGESYGVVLTYTARTQWAWNSRRTRCKSLASVGGLRNLSLLNIVKLARALGVRPAKLIETSR